jgi:hypothetical protein
MNRVLLTSVMLATTLALTLPAHATLLTRTFVSSVGSDSNPCTIAAPCASFAHAYSLTQPFGIVSALDPGKYGPLTITGPITINGNGWAAITAPSGGAGITINAPNTNSGVQLKGLEIDGAGAGANGIVYNSGSGLTVTDCLLQFFVGGTGAGNGILIAPTPTSGGFRIFHTTVANNVGDGILIAAPSGTPIVGGDIEHVVAIGNTNGIVVDTTAQAGGLAGVTIYNSSINSNSSNGIWVNNSTSGTTTEASIDNVAISGNGGTGVLANNTVQVLLRRSSIVGNAVGVNNGTSSNTVFSYGDNSINANSANDIVGTLNNSFTLR